MYNIVIIFKPNYTEALIKPMEAIPSTLVALKKHGFRARLASERVFNKAAYHLHRVIKFDSLESVHSYFKNQKVWYQTGPDSYRFKGLQFFQGDDYNKVTIKQRIMENR